MTDRKSYDPPSEMTKDLPRLQKTPAAVALSVIIVNFNTNQLTLECLRSLYEYAPGVPFEVLLVDNGSSDDIDQNLEEEFPALRLIKIGDNIGYSRANNIGIHNARGKYILLLNSDTKMIGYSLDSLVYYLDVHPGVGAVGPKHLDGNHNFRLSCGAFPNLFSEIVRKIWHYHLSLEETWVRDYLDMKHASLTAVDWVSGSCLMIRRHALEESRLLDEAFFMYFEDIDLCRRIEQAGWVVHYFYDAVIIHYGGQSARQNLMMVYVEYRRSQIYFAWKYYGRIGEFLIRILLLTKYASHFLGSSVAYGFRKLTGRSTSKTFVHILLAKKIIFLTLQSVRRNPLEPLLQPSQKLVEPLPIFVSEAASR